MFLSFTIWLQNTGLGAFMRWSPLAYPIVLTLHLVCISLFGATLLMTDLRLLGWGMRGRAISSVVKQMRVPKRIGFALVVTCGFLVFSSKAEEYYYNPFFRIKAVLLALVVVHAMIFRGSVYSAPSSLDQPHPPASAKLAGGLSLVLWLCIAIAGRSIGYTHAPVGSHHYAELTGPAIRITALQHRAPVQNGRTDLAREPRHVKSTVARADAPVGHAHALEGTALRALERGSGGDCAIDPARAAARFT